MIRDSHAVARRPRSSRSTCRSRSCSCRASPRASGRPGEAIPSELELAARYGVSQGTVRKAIDALAADNLVVRRQGKGTFVATHTEESAVDVPFPAHARATTATTSTRGAALLDVRRGKAGAEIARLLDLKAGDPVVLDPARARMARRAGGARRDHAAGRAVPRPDASEARGLPGLDVRLLRDRSSACAC